MVGSKRRTIRNKNTTQGKSRKLENEKKSELRKI